MSFSRALICASFLWLTVVPAAAQNTAKMTVLLDDLAIVDVIVILHDEGLEHGETLNAEMLNGQGGAFWAGQVSQIYDRDKMYETVRNALETGLSGTQTDAALTFFQSETGVRIIELENAARAAMMDDDVEQAARSYYQSLKNKPDDRFELVQEISDANDLVERNVSGSLTSNFQFFRGLSDGGFIEMSESEMIADVWSQEQDVREDTTEWLLGYLLMAYQPLSDQDLRAYVTFSGTDAGRALNAGLFAGFDRLYADISYALGRAVALEMSRSDL